MARRTNLVLSGIGVVAVLGLAGSLLLWRGNPPPDADAERDSNPNVVEMGQDAQRTVGLRTSEVQEQKFQRSLGATGVVAPNQTRVAHIRPLARGIVEQIYVRLGDRVREGQPLIAYDNIELGELIGDFLSARAALERYKAQGEVARKLLDRAESLIKVEAISQGEFDLRKAEYEQALANIAGQQAEIARTDEKLHRFGLTEEDIENLARPGSESHRTASRNILKAPFAGIITKYDVSPGELVGREREIFTVVDTSWAWVLADVYEKDVGLVRAGGECGVRVASYPEMAFRGRITYVSDFLDPASRTAKVRCEVPNPDGLLKLEMFANIEITSSAKRPVLAVPDTALHQIAVDSVVFVQQDATHFEKRVVETGDRFGDWVEIRLGLRPGERVVTEGGFYVKSALLREQIGGEE